MTQTQSTLQMKTYFSTTVEAAVDLARRELGADAMLVNSRLAPDDVRHLGRYEVIFATGGAASSPTTQARVAQPFHPLTKAAGRKPAATVGPADTHIQLEDIRLQLTTIRQSLGTSVLDSELLGAPSDASLLRRFLETNGIEPALARQLIHSVVRHNPGQLTREQLRAAVAVEMEKRVQVDASLGLVVALVGPPGRGKSTMLVKLAIAQGLARRNAVRILSMDNYRVGANEQMRCFGAILGVGYQSCETIGELDRQLEATRNQDVSRPALTMIDTSGYGPADLEQATELAAYFSAKPEINVHLVLRADTKSAEGTRAIQRYSHFGVSRLIFTGVDEAETFGSVYSIAIQSGKPISFLGTGQRIPEDLEPAAKSQITGLVLEGREAISSAAA